MPASPSIAPCPAARHRPARNWTTEDGIRRTRCLGCGLRLMRTAISRRWIIADELG